jgi:ABC-type nitrate/sulfonate/bicarbonate transport system permease component
MATTGRPIVTSDAPGDLRLGPLVLALIAGAVAWEITSRLLQFPYHPSLAAIVGATWRMTASGEIPGSVGSSLAVLGIAYGGAVVVGIPLGLALGRYRTLAVAVDPHLDILLAVPNLLLVPVFFGIFGIGRTTQVAVVFVSTFVTIANVARSGLAAVTPEQVEMAKAFGADERAIFRRVLLPGALPAIMTSLRLGMSRAVRALIGAEILVGPFGLGALLRQYGGRFDAASVFGILLIVAVFSLAVNYLVVVADRRLNHWAN